jgi:hypothetical protein
MIRVTIELLPANDGQAQQLATLDICNQNLMGEFGDYTFDYRPGRAPCVHGILRRHNRSTGFLSLVAAAFKVLYGP